MLSNAYDSARLAGLSIEVQTTDGTRLAGTPAFGDEWPGDDISDDAELSLGGQTVALRSIVAFVVHAPASYGQAEWSAPR